MWNRSLGLVSRGTADGLLHRGSAAGLVLVLASLVLPAPARAALELSWFTLDGGGITTSAGGTLSLGGTIGQPDAGLLSSGGLTLAGGFWKGGNATSAIEEPPPASTAPFALWFSPCQPNPFTSSTSLRFELPDIRPVQAVVYDQIGRVVRRLSDGVRAPGRHEILWNGRNDEGRSVPSGCYLLSLRAGDRSVRRSVILIR